MADTASTTGAMLALQIESKEQVDELTEKGYPPAAPLPLAEAIHAKLRRAEAPLSRAALRRTLKVNNARLGKTLDALEARGLLTRSPGGWALAVGAPEQTQLAF